MKLRRARHLVSPSRLRVCRELFRDPWQALASLAFVGRRPCRLTLRNGQALDFSRAGRDHLFWDWFLANERSQLEFTADGEVLLRHNGLELLLRPGTADFFIFKEILLNDEYGCRHLPDRLDTVVDLGGNVGLFTCAMLPRARRVITVEPVEANCTQAAKNIARNGGNPADLHRVAVTGRSGEEATIHLSRRNTGMNSLYETWLARGGVQGQEKVPTRTLTDLLEGANCGEVDLLKCDIEGAEFEVFQATSPATLRQVRRLAMEVHLGPAQPHSALDALANRLRQAGFALQTKKIGSRGPSETWFLKGQRKARRVFACRG